MNSPPKFAIPRFDVLQSSRVQHLCFLSSSFSRATIGVVVQVSRAHFLTPPPVTDLFCYIWDTQQKNIDLNWTRFSREKWRINWKTINRFWTQMREIWCKFGQFLASNFLKALNPRAHRTRENERYLFIINWISPSIKEYLCERLNNIHTRIAKCRRRRRRRALSLGAVRRRLCTPPRHHHLRMLKW